jgi:hypothetical protein
MIGSMAGVPGAVKRRDTTSAAMSVAALPWRRAWRFGMFVARTGGLFVATALAEQDVLLKESSGSLQAGACQ